jgi:alpha-methylacyl-CoA racemase
LTRHAGEAEPGWTQDAPARYAVRMGPLSGIRVIEIAGLGPGPFAAMMLADMGADVLRVDRVRAHKPTAPSLDLLARGRPSAGIDLKHPDGAALVLELCERADALIEGFRPGVMERLGLGPEPCLSRNPRLVYGRMTGFGQDGPLASAAGHDIDYIALSGALHAIARQGERPMPPLNLVGDFGGGGMLLAFGVVCALLEARSSGHGQVVDAAMIDGASLLMTMFWGMRAAGFFEEQRPGTNLLDSGAPFYETYRTKDGRFLALGAIEPQFYAELLERLGLADQGLPRQMDRSQWPAVKERFAAVIAGKTRDEWCAIFEGSDACVAPVLTLGEAAEHPHNVARGTFVRAFDVTQPAPAPRFSRTQPEIGSPPSQPGADTERALSAWGVDPERLRALREARVVG